MTAKPGTTSLRKEGAVPVRRRGGWETGMGVDGCVWKVDPRTPSLGACPKPPLLWGHLPPRLGTQLSGNILMRTIYI